ncbi:MAG: hypothetical protein Q7T81_14730 [Pseudolabrys sp.]|nr:hypothetical protein [Pseudolabrys sp.]
MNAEAALKRLRDIGILNSVNKLKSSKDIDSGITIMLFAHAIEGNMEVSMRDGDYAFKMTPKGNKMVEGMGIRLD